MEFFKNMGNRIKNNLIGTPVPTEEIPNSLSIDENGNALINSGIQNNPRKGGALRDLAEGFKQNYNAPFSFDNWEATKQGSGTGNAFRGGEAMGTLARQFARLKNPNFLNGLALAMATGSDLTNVNYNPQNSSIGNIYNMNYKNRQLQNMQDYRMEQLNVRREQNQLRAAIAGAKDNTQRAQIIFSAVNNGTLSPEHGSFYLQQFGIDGAQLQKSNQTRNADVNEALAPHRANALDSGVYYTNEKIGNLERKNQILADELEAMKNGNTPKKDPLGLGI
jgi:hypothetical protein